MSTTSPTRPSGRQSRVDAPTATAIDPALALLAADDVATACRRLVDEAGAAMPGTHSAVGLCRARGTCYLTALAGVDDIDRKSARVGEFESAFDETALRASTIIYLRDQSCQPPAKTVSRLAEILGCDWMVSAPLVNSEQRVVGAWMTWGQTAGQLESARHFVRQRSSLWAAVLPLLEQAQRSAVARLVDTIRHRFDTQQKRRVWLAAAAATLIILVFPFRYRVGCDCQLEPVSRRFVAAPFDATLEASHVEPGDIVKRDQLLAELDGREIRWQLASLTADHAQAKKNRDAALAERKAAAGQLARLEMEQLANRMELLENRSNNLTLRSPVDGVVISGDLERVEGAPLTVGQTLFEVAPLDEIIVEVAVPEHDVAYVHEGAAVAVRLDAYPAGPLEGVIDKIHPRAELRDSEQVFIAEVRVANADRQLRPGMNGRAKISGPFRPLSWILFHRPTAALVRWLGW